jgi:NAD(P)-dependent dehydrogenase (short-subunit alcohol dehydrogenase family)
MDIAIVTGAETPLGLRLIEDLIRQGCRVHGIGNNFSHVTFADKHFVAHAIDLSDLEAVARTAEAILEQEKAIHILIHAIDVTPGAAFEQLPVGNLEAILKVGLLGPVMLTRMALPNLLRFRGQLINIIPANKSGHIASAVNALIEGGLREMNNALFDQARDAGLRVTNLILRQNTVTDDTTFADKHLQTRIDPEHVARTVEQLLNPNEPNVPNEITLYPRLSDAAEEVLPKTGLPIDPYNAVVLPPQKYCPPEQEAILTREPDQIERTIPYTDEEIEEKIASAIEEYESQPERHEEPRRNKKNKRNDRDREPQQSRAESKEQVDQPQQPRTESREQSDQPKQDISKDGEQSDQPKSRRGRRRGGRNRNKNCEQQEDSTSTRNHERSQTDSKEIKSPVGDKEASVNSKKAKISTKAPRSGRNRNRTPVVRPDEKYPTYEQSSTPVAEHSKSSSQQPKQDSFQPREVVLAAPIPTQEKKAAKPKKKAPAKPQQQLELVSDRPAVKKKAAKKAAKKTTREVVAKKVGTKKAVKKATTKKTAIKKVTKKTATKKATKKAAKKIVKKPK